MTDRLLAVAMVAAAIGVSYPLCMRAAPHRGVMPGGGTDVCGYHPVLSVLAGALAAGTQLPTGAAFRGQCGFLGLPGAGAGGVCLLAALKVDNLGALQRGSDQRVAVQLAFAVENNLHLRLVAGCRGVKTVPAVLIRQGRGFKRADLLRNFNGNLGFVKSRSAGGRPACLPRHPCSQGLAWSGWPPDQCSPL